MDQHKINKSYKTIPCKFFPNCYKGDNCTFLHIEKDLVKNNLQYIINFNDLVNESNQENKEKNSFILFVEEINKFIEIYKRKNHIAEIPDEFWKKELKYFQGLNEYLENT